MEFTINEAIHIIVRFYLPLGGVWKNEPIEKGEIYRFISAGYASLDDEYGEKYILNGAGRDLMHPYIQQISEQFIAFMHSNCSECSRIKAYEWFDSYFRLDDMEIAEDICTYICMNLDRYGHKVLDCYNSRKGKFYCLKEITE